MENIILNMFGVKLYSYFNLEKKKCISKKKYKHMSIFMLKKPNLILSCYDHYFWILYFFYYFINITQYYNKRLFIQKKKKNLQRLINHDVWDLELKIDAHK